MNATHRADESEPPANDEAEDEPLYGLDGLGPQQAAAAYCEIDAEGEASTKTKIALREAYQRLIRLGAAPAGELRSFFRPVDHPDPDLGRYIEGQADEWWRDVAADQLAKLPGVDVVESDDPDAVFGPRAGATWRFDGVDDPAVFDAVDEEHIAPLAEIRADPEVQAELVMDRHGVARRGVSRRGHDRREVLLDLFETVRRHGEIDADDLLDGVDSDRLGPAASPREFWESAARAVLQDFPDVSVEVDAPRDPEEIPVETMADVRAGYRELEGEPREILRYGDGGGAGAADHGADARGYTVEFDSEGNRVIDAGDDDDVAGGPGGGR